MSEIGVGAFVEYVGRSPKFRRGQVTSIRALFEGITEPCGNCGSEEGGLFVCGDDDPCLWCPCAWKPFHGPEQVARTREEVAT
jgi:hypothetical protein